MTQIVEVPRIEDEIEQAWQAFCARHGRDDSLRGVFDAGFRAARTFTLTGARANLGGVT